MASSNFDGEIKDAMASKSNAKGGSKQSKGGNYAPPSGMKQHSSGSVANAPPSPHQYQPPQPQAQGQAGLQQAADQFTAHMGSSAGGMPGQDGLAQAHHQIVSALAQRDMLGRH